MAEIAIKVKADTTAAEKAVDGFSGKLSQTGGKLTRGLTLPILGAGAAIVGLGKKAGENADRLLDMSAQTGISTDKLQEMEYVAGQAGVSQDFYKKSVEEVIKAQDMLQKGTGPAAEALDALGVSVKDANGEMRSAETITDEAMKALEAVKDPTERAALAQDIFKRSNQDMLAALSLGTGEIDKQRQAAHDLGAVQSGDSLAGANKFRAGMEKLQAQLGGVVGLIGGELAPILSDTIMPLIEQSIVPAIRKFAGFVGKLTERFNRLSPGMRKIITALIGAAAVIGPVLIGVGKLIKVFGAVGQAFKVLSAIMAANPWVLLIAAVIALVALIVANWDKIKKYLSAVWDWIKGAAEAVGKFLSAAFETAVNAIKFLFENFTPLGFLIKHFDTIKKLVTAVKDWFVARFDDVIGFLTKIPGRITSALGDLFKSARDLALGAHDWIVDKWEAIIRFLTGLPGKVTAAIGDLFGGVRDAFRSAINWIIDKWNALDIEVGPFKVPSWVPLVGGKSFHIPDVFPDVPRLHSGGVYRSPAGQTEGLALLKDRETVLPAGAGGMTVNNHYHIAGSVVTERQLTDRVRRNLLDLQRRNNTTGIA